MGDAPAPDGTVPMAALLPSGEQQMTVTFVAAAPELARLRQELADTKTQLAVKEAELAQFKTLHAESSAKVSELEGVIKAQAVELRAQAEEIGSLRATIVTLQATIARLEATIAELQLGMDGMQQSHGEAIRQLREDHENDMAELRDHMGLQARKVRESEAARKGAEEARVAAETMKMGVALRRVVEKAAMIYAARLGVQGPFSGWKHFRSFMEATDRFPALTDAVSRTGLDIRTLEHLQHSGNVALHGGPLLPEADLHACVEKVVQSELRARAHQIVEFVCANMPDK